MLLIAATMASTFAESRPSEKFGTHSISRFIVWASCSSLSSCRDAPSCLAALVLGLAASAAYKRSAALSPANLSRTSDSAPPEGPRGERLGPPERPFSAAWATWAKPSAHLVSPATAVQSSASSPGEQPKTVLALARVPEPAAGRSSHFLLSPQGSLSTGAQTKSLRLSRPRRSARYR